MSPLLKRKKLFWLFISVALILLGVFLILPKPRFNHTKFDKDLGWVSQPNYYKKDAFGHNVSLEINAQGFRNNRDFDIQAPPKMLRLVCSGDSFAFGYGVSNENTWCEQVSRMMGLQAINMGQGGYGIDQSYLWYLRDGQKFEHHVQVFSIIYDDFNRFGPKFLGYNKPTVILNNGKLIAGNVPVKKQSLLQRQLERIFLSNIPNAKNMKQHRALAVAIFEDLNRINQLKESHLLVVYLPTYKGDLLNDQNKGLRLFLEVELAKEGIMFLDLTEDFRRLGIGKFNRMFNLVDKNGGHYTQEGNAFVARIIQSKLASVFLTSGK